MNDQYPWVFLSGGRGTAPESVIANLRATNKAQILKELARRAAATTGLDEGGILTALSYLAYLGGDWPWPLLAMFTVGLSALMVCRIRFVKLSRVLIPAIRRLPEEIRW